MAGGDLPGGQLDVVERPQVGPDNADRDGGEHDDDRPADDQVK